MALHRRSMLAICGTGFATAVAGCLPGEAKGDGTLTIGTSYPDPQTLGIAVAPDYEAERVFTETITVSEDATPIEREEVVTGRNGDEFYVEVREQSQDVTYETFWELDCADAERPDRLDVTVTEWGDVRFSQNRCGSGFEDSPPEPPTE
jgi:hypothetical protein